MYHSILVKFYIKSFILGANKLVLDTENMFIILLPFFVVAVAYFLNVKETN